MPSLSSKLASLPAPAERRPVWQGPSGEGPQGGVTQGILGKYLVCPERARIALMDGLRPVERFDYRIEFGQAWHLCEEVFAKAASGTPLGAGDGLTAHCLDLSRRYPMDREQVDKVYNVVRVTFPLYQDYWARHPDVTGRTPLLQEWCFDVPYRLPSGRTVRLRGKMDGLDLIDGLWMAEHKTKSDIDEEKIRNQLTYDLQTAAYAIALQEAIRQHLGGADVGLPEEAAEWGHRPFLGVRYNVIRRPLSGGKGSIVQKQGKPPAPCGNCNGTGRTAKLGKVCGKCKGLRQTPAVPGETKADYYARAAQYVKDAPGEYFARWQVRIGPADLARFRRECLDPVLENLLDDYEWWTWCGKQEVLNGPYNYSAREDLFPYHTRRHFRVPYGIWSSMLEDTHGDLDEFLRSGNETGLRRVTNLFPELQGD